MYTELGCLLTEQAKVSDIPEVLFTDNADLRNTIRRIVARTNEMDVSVENIITATNEFTDMQAAQTDTSYDFEVFEKITNAFANKLHEGQETLRGVKKTVTALAEQISEHAAMRIAEDSVLSKIYNISRDLNIPAVEWKYLDSIDEHELRYGMHNSIGIDSDRAITPSVIELLINKMPCANQYNQVDLKKIELEPEKFNNIINRVYGVINYEPKEYIAGCIRNLFNLTTSDVRAAITAVKDLASGKTAGNLNNIMRAVVCYYNIMNVMSSIDLDIAASTKAELNAHIDVMYAISNMNTYLAYNYRNNVWHNAVLVPGPMCNTDNYDEQTCNMEQIVQHSVSFYNNTRLPIQGISGEFISKTAKQIEDNISAEATRNATKITERKNEIERNAFVVNTANYLTKNKDKFCDAFKTSSNTDLYKFAESIYDSMPGQPAESKLYKTIMRTQFQNNIVSTIYERLNKAYVNYVSSVGNMTEQACEELDVAVYSDLISEYLVDKGILIV